MAVGTLSEVSSVRSPFRRHLLPARFLT